MRITFLGKGGSGKTTLATSFVKYLENKNKKVLAIDADINVNLGTALDMPKRYLGDIFDCICKDLESNNDKPLIGSSPATRESIFIKEGLDDPFLKKYATYNNFGTALLTVGTYYWEYGEPLRTVVLKDGGLETGAHELKVEVRIAVFYFPKDTLNTAVLKFEM